MKSPILLFCFIYFFTFNSCNKTELNTLENSNSYLGFINFDGNPTLQSTEVTSDGGMICSGWVDGNGKDGRDGFLMKLDAKGNKIWQRFYGGDQVDNFYHVIQTSDGGYIAVGSTQSYGFGVTRKDNIYDAFMVKTDSLGNLVWYKTFGSIEYDDFRYVMETPDHDFVCTGTSAIAAKPRIFLIKVKPTGAVIFNKTHTIATGVNIGITLATNKFGDYFLGGLGTSINSPADGDRYKTILARINSSTGNIIWSQIYTDFVRESFILSGFSEPAQIKIIIKDWGFYIGTYLIHSDYSTKIQLLKTDSSGAILWQKQYAGLGNSVFSNMIETKEGGFLIAGGSSTSKPNLSYMGGFKDLKTSLLKVDSNGNEIWTKYSGGELVSSNMLGVQSTADRYMAVGSSLFFNKKKNTIFVMHTDSNGMPLN